MINQSLKTTFKYIVLSLLCLQVIACNKKGESSSEVAIEQTDSIRKWISKSKQSELDFKSKSVLLNKAYVKATSLANDSLKCNYYSTISLQLLNINDSLLFRRVNKNGLQLSGKIKDSVSRANFLWDLGIFLKRNKIQDSAYYQLSKAEKTFSTLGNHSNSGRLLNNMANVQNYIGDYTGSEITSTEAIKKLKPLEEYKELYNSYDNLGDVTKLLGEYNRSLAYYEDALVFLIKAELGAFQEQTSKNNIGLVYQKMGQHQKATSLFFEVLQTDSLLQKKPSTYARTLNNLGYSYLKIGQLEQLPGLFQKAFKIQDSIKDINGMVSSTQRLAEYFMLKNDTVAALIKLKESQKYAKQTSSNKQMLEILSMFPQVDPKNAKTYFKNYRKLSDSLQNQERQLRGKFARIRFETDEFIAENELLARQRQLWVGIALAIFLLSAAAFVIISQRIKNQKLKFQQEQQASNQEIFNLLLSSGEKLEEGKQIEQKRISEELHDGVQGRLQGARMILLGLNKRDDDMAKTERARAIVMLKDVQEEVRAISHELSHAAYQKIHNFILTLEDLITTMAKSAEIEINFKYAELLDWDALSGDIKINMYRIIQESLQNAVKHAQCAKIDLNLEADEKRIEVSINDDGKGFHIKKGKKGIGMRNINSRMEKVGGTWDIDSKIGKGTTVTFLIPIIDNNQINNVLSEHKNLQET